MGTNREQVKKEIVTLKGLVEGFFAKANTYVTKKEEIKNDNYLGSDGKTMHLNTLAETFKKECQTAYDTIKAQLDIVKEKTREVTSQFDISDSQFMDVLLLVNTMQGKLSEEIRNQIISTYADNNQALIMLRDVFANYDDRAAYDIESHIVNVDNVERALKSIDDKMYFTVRDYENAAYNIKSILKKVDELAGYMHIEDDEKSFAEQLQEGFDRSLGANVVTVVGHDE